MSLSPDVAELRNAFASSCRLLRGPELGAEELELVITQATAAAEGSHRRLVTAVRVAGYGALVCFALAATWGVYHTIASIGGLL